MPRGVGAAQKKGVHAPKAHKLAEEFAPRTVLQDVFKKRWQLSSVIGQGGFGMIYLASDKIGSVDEKAANHVIKIEPKENGPLYCEMQFYQRVAKPHSIQSFITSHKLRYLSVPPYISTGRHMQSGKEFRFLVMPRFGTDLQKYLVQNGGHFNAKTVFAVGLRMLDALEFLHNNEFVHADVKAANILTGYHAGSEVMNEVYLVDYGLAYRYTVDGVHKEYKEDPRKAHDGTIEFTSRDAHKGVAPSRRADLEILGYCLLQWLCGRLPWEDRLSDLRYVADSKERLTADPGLLIRACHSGPRPPSLECICKYMDKVNALDYDSRPDYTGFRDLMRSAGLKAGLKDEWKLDLGASVGTMQAKGPKRKSGDDGTPHQVKKRKSSSPVKSPTQRTPKAKSPKKNVVSKDLRRKSPVKSPAGKAATSKSPRAVKPTPSKKAGPKRKSGDDGTPHQVKKRKSSSPVKSPTQRTPKAKSPKKNCVVSKDLRRKSPVKSPAGKAATSKSPRAVKPTPSKKAPKKRLYEMPAVTKPSFSASTSSVKKTVRRVRRVAAVQSDMSIQTSPSLLNKR